MPLLQRAEKVTVLYVKGGNEVPGPPASDIVRYLQRNGIPATLMTVEAGRRVAPPAKRCWRRRSHSTAICW